MPKKQRSNKFFFSRKLNLKKLHRALGRAEKATDLMKINVRRAQESILLVEKMLFRSGSAVIIGFGVVIH